MSESEQQRIMKDLAAFARVARYVFPLLFLLAGSMAGIVTIAVTDHFMVKQMSATVAEIKPRVEQLWWKDQAKQTKP